MVFHNVSPIAAGRPRCASGLSSGVCVHFQWDQQPQRHCAPLRVATIWPSMLRGPSRHHCEGEERLQGVEQFAGGWKR